MDPLTHFLTGACLGRSGFNRKTAYATLAMTLAAEAPDIDVLSSLRGPVTGFAHHRGMTHTLLGAPLMALAVTGIVYGWHRWRVRRQSSENMAAALGGKHQAVRWGWVWLCCLIADLSHLLLDYTNNYGIRPFYPFSPRWYSWDIVYIVEPIILLLLIAALVLPALFGLVDREMTQKRAPFRGRALAIAALSCVVLLYALRNAEHGHALALVRAAQPSEEAIVRVRADPAMLNPFLWHAVVETKNAYQTADVYSLGDRVETDNYSDVVPKTPVTAAVAAAKRSELGRVYQDWSSWPVIEDLGDQPVPGDFPRRAGWHTIGFRDMRFAPELPSGVEGPLRGWVYVGPGGEIESQIVNGREQKH